MYRNIDFDVRETISGVWKTISESTISISNQRILKKNNYYLCSKRSQAAHQSVLLILSEISDGWWGVEKALPETEL